MACYHRPDANTLQALKDMANTLRIHSITATSEAGSGHPTSCCSCAEIMSVLFFHAMKYKPHDPKNPNNDRFVLSKGHAAPILYAAWAEAGYLNVNQLLTLRKMGSILEGHPVPKLAFVDVATGSLGQGLGAAAGMAYTGKYFDKASYRVFCLLGDGESSEGSVWEAMAFASHYRLDNLLAIIDVNRLGQSDPAPLQHKVEAYRKRCEAFGWTTEVVDGHSVDELCKAFWQATMVENKPCVIIAKTTKGKGIEGVEDKENWHGKAIPKDKLQETIQAIKCRILEGKKLTPGQPVESASTVNIEDIQLGAPPKYKHAEKVATRKAFGTALAKIGHSNDRIIALDGDTKNSTFSEMFKKEYPKRYIECFIAEQNMVSVGVGCCARDRTVPFVSTFSTFFSRAFDQIRMAAISESNINLVGSHCGVSIGEDGPSQMGLEDLALFRAIPTATIFYPSDAVSTERAVELAANTKGICFIRTTRPETTIIYKNTEMFEVGKAKVLKKTDKDMVTIVAAGVTMQEALTAAAKLAEEDIFIRVVDPFTIKPLDDKTIVCCTKGTKKKHVITVEDHYYEGGLGEAVAAALASEPTIIVHRLAVSGVPFSATPAELLERFEIDAKAIVKTVKDIISN
ncbi:transketolase-like isoform X1 [Chiloscyllium plagiosum]|uniref:transketolase-like isoform X1 n=1 Tax=Chiloscyllium plagiosum TaxID=36176 RepID=UPI001CB84DBD|nr:transketolase-like isoform X1 [Chiloscyllium plagiosum]